MAIAAPPPLAPGRTRNLVLCTSLLIAVMASLDITIVAVALPYMAGNLSTGPDEITWVVTMFAVGQAITIGITGHLARVLGRRRLAIIVVVGFVGSSICCAAAGSLTEIVMFRFIQGLFSGPLIPLSQSMLIDAYPEKDRNKALSYWSMGVLGGPALGPVIGGYLTQELSWRWSFWINLPIGVLALIMIISVVRPTPRQSVHSDFMGLVLLGIAIVAYQIVLDRGNELDWFQSRQIVILSIIALCIGAAFVLRGISLGQRNIVNLTLFKDTNFTACSVLMGIEGSIFLGLLIINPEFMIDYLGWEVETTGLVMGVAGIFGILGANITGTMVRYVGIRTMLITGCSIMAIGWFQYSRLALGASMFQVVVPSSLIMLGIMFVTPMLASQAFQNLPPDQRDEGAGLFNFVKTMGFALGVMTVDTIMYRGTQANWNRYGGEIREISPILHQIPANLSDAQFDALLGAQLQLQSGILTVTQLAETLALLSVASIPLAFLVKARKPG
ncbi:MAG: DHA2 family efflux MFS transporter permease subunit [Halioglobus sp.]|nr:DHA2 family efflux MFS transporter permease subunit [Halioglobus sp.]